MSNHDITYLTDVSLLTCVVQTGLRDEVLKAARDAGASTGAVSHSARGIGVRERLGLLGVAVETQKDVISILISTEQTDLVFDTVYKAAGLDTPGRGFNYVTPLEKVSTYLPESVRERIEKSG